MITECKYCKHDKFYIIEKEPHFGLYCTNCHKYQSWIKKDELEEYINNKNVEVNTTLYNKIQEKLQNLKETESIDFRKPMYSRHNGEEIRIDNVDLNYVFDGRDGETGFCLNWESNIGYGQLTFIKNNDNGCVKYFVESEAMSDNNDKRFINLVLQKFIEKLNVIE